MEKIIVRYLIFLKCSLKDKMMWFNIALMLCLAFLFARVIIFDTGNTKVMLYAESDTAQPVITKITSVPSVFSFEIADSEDDLEEKVRSGAAECGFIFRDGFEDHFKNGKKGGIDFAVSPFTVKGTAAKETVFSVLMETYAGDLLAGEAGNIFKEEDAGLEKTMQYYEKIRPGDEVFSVKYESIDGAATVSKSASNKVFPVHGIIALIIFSYGLFSENENHFGKYSSFGKAFSSSERGVMLIEKRLASLTVPVFAGLIAVRIFEPSANILQDILPLCFLLIYTTLWVSVFTGIFKREESYICWSLLFLIVSFAATPIIWNIGEYAPVLSKVSGILPNGAYLQLYNLFMR